MAKNMYQKREERKQNRLNNDEQGGFKKTVINWYPGHMAKTKREIKEMLQTIDIVIHMIDARIPKSSYIEDLSQFIKNKKVIMVFNKYDLCDKPKTHEFIKHYEKEGYTVITCDSKRSNDYKKVISICEDIMKPENNARKEKGLLSKKAKALIVGVPNVGKSTLINKIAGRKIASVANKPGVTRNLNTVKLNSKINLIDSPGILWPKISEEEVALNLGSMGIIKEEVLPIQRIAIHILSKLNENYKDILYKELGIKEFNINKIEEMYLQISKNKNIKCLNDEIDYNRVSLLIFNLIKSEKIKNITFDNL